MLVFKLLPEMQVSDPSVSREKSNKQSKTRVSVNPTYFCDKLHNNLKPWNFTGRYNTDDFVIGLFSGENIFYSRANTCRDTWLHEFKHWYIYGATTEPLVPITGLEKYGVKPYHVRHSDVQLIQLYGLREMYVNHPDKKWYGIWGDDTMLHPEYMLNLISKYNHEEALWISPGVWPSKLKPWINVDKYPKFPKAQKDKNHYMWSSGAFGWFFTNSVMKDYAEHIEEFVAENRVSEICFCPDKITGLLLSLLGHEITQLPRKEQDSMLAGDVDSYESTPRRVEEYVLYHYLFPSKMVAADERIKHEKLDRIVNCGGRKASQVSSGRNAVIFVLYCIVNCLLELARHSCSLCQCFW